MSIFFLLQMGKDDSEWRSRPQFNFKCQDLSLILLWLINMLVNCWLVANELIYKLREDLTINVEVTSKIVKCCWTDSCVFSLCAYVDTAIGSWHFPVSPAWGTSYSSVWVGTGDRIYCHPSAELNIMCRTGSRKWATESQPEMYMKQVLGNGPWEA